MPRLVDLLRRPPRDAAPSSPPHRTGHGPYAPTVPPLDAAPLPQQQPTPHANLLADLVAGLLGLFVAALGLLIACGWFTTLWGAVLLATLLLAPLLIVLAVLLRA